ncbi:MAG: lysophospholipid acyltransferase family protein [Candidatus Paceibacterota bacterium]
MKNRKYWVPRLIPQILQPIICALAWLFFKIFAKIEFRGTEKVRALSSGAIFAANHVSELDVPLLRIGLPFFGPLAPLYYVSRPKEFYTKSGWRKIFYGGLLFRLLGSYPAYSGHRDYAYSLQDFDSLLKAGRSVAIFPEGKRTVNGEIDFAHGGVAFLAHTYRKPVVPIAIHGLYKLSLRDLLLFKRRIVITYGDPIQASALVPQQHPTVKDFQAGSQYLMARIAEMLPR